MDKFNLLEKAKDALAENKELIAIHYLEEYIKYNRNDFSTWFLLGNASRELGAFKKSEEAFKNSLRLASQNEKYDALFSLGRLYSQHGKLNEAEECFKKAANSNELKRKGWFWVIRGSNLMMQDKLGLAEKYFLKTIELKSEEMDEAYLNLGFLFRNQKKYDEAIEAFKNTLKISPNYSEAQKVLDELTELKKVL